MELDQRLLCRPSKFGGKDGDWNDWVFTTRAYLDTVDEANPDALDEIESTDKEIKLPSMSTKCREASRKTYFVLIMLLTGPPLLQLRSVERGNGYEAWRRLHERYDSSTTSRVASLLQSIMRPTAFPQDSAGFEAALQEWQLQVQRWESLAVDMLNDAVKRQILLEQSPHAIRSQLMMHNHALYAELRPAVLSFVVSSWDWSSQPSRRQQRGGASGTAPMEVDALMLGQCVLALTLGKGKGKVKGR